VTTRRKALPYNPYDPLDTGNIADSLAQQLLRQAPQPLLDLPLFLGAGSYVIYYTGDFPAYHPLTAVDSDGHPTHPIYIGKADPKGRRKGKKADSEEDGFDPLGYTPDTELHSRLTKHARTIQDASNLNIDDFSCRYLVISPIFAALGESVLISRYMPVWNTTIDGFGNNDPGRGRYSGLRPMWDVLHPGRAWADKCQPRLETAEQITAMALQYIKERSS
jgi:hypothetical protein